MQVNAYHGTTAFAAENIIRQQRFIHSSKNTEWLGEGVYFFGYKKSAVDWAKNEAQKPKNKRKGGAAVLAADLSFEDNQLLDLDDPEQLDRLTQFLQEYIDKTDTKFGYSKWEEWCLACNLFRRMNEDIRITRYTFHFSSNDYVKLYNSNQLQYCVSDDSVISNIRKEMSL